MTNILDSQVEKAKIQFFLVLVNPKITKTGNLIFLATFHFDAFKKASLIFTQRME